MRFVIIGAGGVGSVTGALLARAGADVCLVARQAHADAINAHGLEVTEKNGERWTADPAAVGHVADAALAHDDVIFVTAKSYDTAHILADIKAALPSGPRALVMVQNGVTNERDAETLFDHIYGAMAYFQGRLLGPGKVGAGIRRIVLGRYPSGVDALSEDIARRLNNAGVQASVSPTIMADKWSKLVTNCGNAIYAIANLTGGAAFANRAAVELMNRTWAEAEAVLAEAAIDHVPVKPLPEPSPNAAPPPPDPVDFYGSTWDDLTAQKGKTEVDWFNGEIVRLGAAHDVPTPINTLLLNITNEMAVRRELPGRFTAEALLAEALRGI